MTTSTPTSFHLGRASFAAGALFFVVLQLPMPAFGDARGASDGVTTISGAARVVDGDTIEIDGQRIRLEGIDAPETAQTCGAKTGGTWACGRGAAKALQALVSGSDVSCDSRGRDKYGRVLGICFTDGRDVNATMVKSGMAWAFTKYSQSYVAEEAVARATLSGVWQGPSEAPWDYRHKGWQVAEADAPQGCAIKGNVTSKGHIYHMPWSPWYDRVTVDSGRGEQWFCSEADAQAAGWRPALSN